MDSERITENIVKTKKTHTTGSYLITDNAMKYLLENIKSYSKEIVDVFYAEEIQKVDLIVIVHCLIFLNKKMDTLIFSKAL